MCHVVGAGSTPAFVDYNGDGDVDLVVGGEDGTLQYYEKFDDELYPVLPLDSPFAGVDVGASSTPAFVDLDGDGDPDLVTESARACSYIVSEEIQKAWSIWAVIALAVNVLAVNRPLSLYIVSKSGLCTLFSVIYPLSVLSEVWKFRTRTCEYTVSGPWNVNGESASRAAEVRLENRINSIEEELLQSDALSTSDYSKYLSHSREGLLPVPAYPHLFVHGQYRVGHAPVDVPDARPEDDEERGEGSRRVPDPSTYPDQHHCPLQPDDYVELRIDALLKFYQKRIPRYYRCRLVVQVAGRGEKARVDPSGKSTTFLNSSVSCRCCERS